MFSSINHTLNQNHYNKARKKKASLIEPGTANFMGHILKRCGVIRKERYNNILNVCIGTMFVLVVGGTLYYAKRVKNHKKQTKQMDDYQKQAYIMETIQKIHNVKNTYHNELASNIPFESELHKKDKLFM